MLRPWEMGDNVKFGNPMASIVIGAAVIVALLGGAWLAVSLRSGDLQTGGMVLGIFLLAVPVLVLGGAGLFLLSRGRQEATEDAARVEMRRILDLVESRGEIPVSDLVFELKSTREKVQQQVHALVGMGLFSGYINWDDGILYSAQASSLRSLDRCKKCGGELKLAGKGVVKCPYCGTEYFLS